MIHPRPHHPTHRAFTLIEALGTIVALSIIAATLGPIVYAAADSYSSATSHRSGSESAAHAIDRMVRAIREIPAIEGSDNPNITNATSTTLTWANANALVYDALNQRITLTLDDQPRATLADRVQALSLRYLDELAQPIDITEQDALQNIRRIEISLTIQGTEHRAAATIRDGLGAE